MAGKPDSGISSPSFSLDKADFALDMMPGRVLHDILRGYRERGPITSTRFLALPAFIITGHAELLDAFKDTQRFPPHRMYKASFEAAIGESFISMEDPEQHRIYRKLATPAFRSRAVASYAAEGLTALAQELATELEGRESFDLMTDYAARFPYRVIAGLLGLPRDREDAFHEWALALLRFRDNPGAGKAASRELTDFLGPVVEARRKEPRNDVITELVQARVEGKALGDDEIYSHVRLLLPTGGETTHGSLGNLLFALLSHEGAWEGLRRDRRKIPGAVDEALRWESPIAVLPRMSCNVDTEFHGVKIPADSWVLFAMAGANRDPAVFDQPDRFDLERNNTESLSFGKGVKACPGSHLAKKNLGVALDALLDRLPSPSLIDPEGALPQRSVLRCPEALKVRSERFA
jgi:cytochrome P450